LTRALSLIAAVSGLYDLVIGAGLLLAPVEIASWFGAPAPSPLLHVNIAGWLLIGIGIGYWQPFRDPVRHRAYLWIMGPVLKGGGAAIFLIDHFARQSPASFLLFALTDGMLALATLWALLASRDRAAARA
jgi:hypothetical protein